MFFDILQQFNNLMNYLQLELSKQRVHIELKYLQLQEDYL